MPEYRWQLKYEGRGDWAERDALGFGGIRAANQRFATLRSAWHDKVHFSTPNVYRLIWIEDGAKKTLTSAEVESLVYLGVEPYPTPQESPIPMPSIIPPPPPSNPGAIADIKIQRDKATNRLNLVINAKPLHELLQSIGVPESSIRFQQGPQNQGFDVVHGSRLATDLFLRKEYPLVINLGAAFSVPPTIARLREICTNARDTVREILEHYQPIDISVTIQKRLIGER